MKHLKQSMKFVAAVVIALGVAVAGIAGISPANVQAAAPQVVANATQIAASLVGNSGGAFSEYQVAYPGGADVDITLTYQPSDPVTSSAFGFNVYGYNGYQGQGAANGDLGALTLNYRADDATTLLVQVYNYLDGAPVAYQLVVSGLPATTASVAVPATAPATETKTAAPATTINAAQFGQSAGNPGGGIQLLTINYPGDGADTTLTLTYSPDDPSYSAAIGFKVYDPMGNLIAEGQRVETPATRTATFSSAVAGQYTVQIYNYVDGLNILYTLVVSR